MTRVPKNSLWFRSLAVLVALTLGGCTAAQMQAYRISANTRSAVDRMKACRLAVYNSAEFAPLRPHIPFDIQDATLEQMTSSSMANDQETKAIYATHPQLQECRHATLESAAETTPTIVPILTDGWDRQDSLLISVVQKKATWGEYLRGSKEIFQEVRARLAAEGVEIAARLQRSHEAEVTRRQAALATFVQQQQNQQLINALNRPILNPPVTTSCQDFGLGTVQCTSH